MLLRLTKLYRYFFKPTNTDLNAIDEFVKRQSGISQPKGFTHGSGVWLPYSSERCRCCDVIKPEFGYTPGFLFNHCKSLKHVCRLFGANYRKCKRVLLKGGVYVR